MRIEDFPNLLIIRKLLRPINISLDSLQDSKSYLSATMPDIPLYGIFVMSLSSVEVMLADVMKYFLMCFPKKVPTSEFKFNKEDFFSNYFTLISKVVENHVNGLSYKSFDSFFKIILEYLSTGWPDFDNSFGADLKEIKASRNLLLHNKLIVNDQYLESAGDRKRASNKGSLLKIDYNYVNTSMDKMIEFEEVLKLKLEEKYKDYTKIRANRSLWQFMFKSPLMIYDDFWIYDETKDEIPAFKIGKHGNGLSGSEAMGLGLWRAHFTSNGEHIRHFHMRSLDRENQEKVMFFLSIAGDFSFW